MSDAPPPSVPIRVEHRLVVSNSVALIVAMVIGLCVWLIERGDMAASSLVVPMMVFLAAMTAYLKGLYTMPPYVDASGQKPLRVVPSIPPPPPTPKEPW